MNASDNGSTRRERRHFSAAQKGAIVKAHLVEKVPISDLSSASCVVKATFAPTPEKVAPIARLDQRKTINEAHLKRITLDVDMMHGINNMSSPSVDRQNRTDHCPLPTVG